ncbi:MAG: 50S ribosomal protein L29 [Gammaproteobacteria bacterium]|nr:50S ribosomal protein L29 [Gammaproteobacteria bacterium]
MASAQEYRNMSEKDLNAELINLRREQFSLRMQMGSGNTPKIHRFSIVRHDIARIKTVLTEMTSTAVTEKKGN